MSRSWLVSQSGFPLLTPIVPFQDFGGLRDGLEYKFLDCIIATRLWTLEYLFRGNVIIHRAHKAIQGDYCHPRRRSWLRFPWLSPIRNSFELRGLCRRSYFGPRTCGRGITNVSKLAGLSIRVSPSHPYCPISGVCETVWNTSF